MDRKTVKVLRCHHDDWLRHIGWWATANDPLVRTGEVFEFDFDGTRPKMTARAVEVMRPHSPREAEAAKLGFESWWLIKYEPVKIPISEHFSDIDHELIVHGVPGEYLYLPDGVKILAAGARWLLPILQSFVESCDETSNQQRREDQASAQSSPFNEPDGKGAGSD
jgi:hypothetical protein